MARGYSRVELANQALDMLGRNRIASLSESSTEARKMNEVFDRVLKSVLGRSHWSFARKIQAMAGLTNDYEERWSYKYDLPNDCLTFIRIIPRVDAHEAEPQVRHQLLGAAVYCNESSAKAEYVFPLTDTVQWPQLALDAAAMLLARDVSMPLTKKMDFWERFDKWYEEDKLPKAIQHDAGQEPIFYVQSANGYIDARGADAENWPEGAAVDGSIYWA